MMMVRFRDEVEEPIAPTATAPLARLLPEDMAEDPPETARLEEIEVEVKDGVDRPSDVVLDVSSRLPVRSIRVMQSTRNSAESTHEYTI